MHGLDAKPAPPGTVRDRALLIADIVAGTITAYDPLGYSRNREIPSLRNFLERYIRRPQPRRVAAQAMVLPSAGRRMAPPDSWTLLWLVSVRRRREVLTMSGGIKEPGCTSVATQLDKSYLDEKQREMPPVCREDEEERRLVLGATAVHPSRSW